MCIVDSKIRRGDNQHNTSFPSSFLSFPLFSLSFLFIDYTCARIPALLNFLPISALNRAELLQSGGLPRA
jgi:hypothetical protein